MARLLGTICLGAALVMAPGCDDDDNPLDPTPESARFTAQLLPSNEVPPVTGPESAGSGTVTIELDVDRDDGVISDAEADFHVVLAGFPAGTVLTAAHIHSGVQGQNGGIVVNTGLTSGEVVLTAGSGSFDKDDVNVTPTIAQQILDSPQSFYFNVHSANNPNGVARGQLVRQP